MLHYRYYSQHERAVLYMRVFVVQQFKINEYLVRMISHDFFCIFFMNYNEFHKQSYKVKAHAVVIVHVIL